MLLDWFPFKNWFRVSGGLILNRNKLELGARAQSEGVTIEIGDETFQSDLVGRLDGKIEYNSVAPYLGFGISNPVGRGNKFSLFLELGAMFQGSAKGSLSASGSISTDSDFIDDLEFELDEIEDDTFFDDLPIYPVLQLGLSYQF